jgi:hypothetical protein
MSRNDLKHQRRLELSVRLRELRKDLYGQNGSRFLADALEIPEQTWSNYESGVTVPAEIVLELQVLTSVTAGWLLTGDGEKYNRGSRE